MPKQPTTKRKKYRKQPQANTATSQSISEPIQPHVETLESDEATYHSPPKVEVAEPRAFMLVLQSWLPIILNFAVFAVIVYQSSLFSEQSQAMRDTLSESITTRQIENRAWLTIKGASVQQIAIGQPLTVVITYTNSGGSPALRAHVSLTIEVRDEVTNTHATYKHEMKAETVVGPGTDVKSVKVADAPMDEPTLLLLTRNKLSISGVIEYMDIFDKPHHTTFCLRYNHPDLNLEDCGGTAD